MSSSKSGREILFSRLKVYLSLTAEGKKKATEDIEDIEDIEKMLEYVC